MKPRSPLLRVLPPRPQQNQGDKPVAKPAEHKPAEQQK
jgi:hypothetical protein